MGSIARAFVQDCQFCDNATVVAVAARDPVRTADFATQYNVPVAHSAADDLFRDDRVDAIYVATPHSLHYEHCMGAIGAGKAVLCEKPLTTSVSQCRRLIAAAHQYSNFLAEAMWTWFLPAVEQARAWVERGDIGQLQRITAAFGFAAQFDPTHRLFDPALAGGCLLDIGIYPLALARFMTRRGPDRVTADALFATTGVEDELQIKASYGQVEAQFHVSFRRRLSNSAVLIGSEGRIELPEFWQAREAALKKPGLQDQCWVDHRRGSGLEHEIAAISHDICLGRTQSERVPLEASLALQVDMEAVRAATSL